jgi:NADH-quinone oxidoreductase subunit N
VIEFNFTAEMFTAILPEIGLLALAVIIMIMDVTLPREQRRVMGWIVAGGLVAIIIVSIFAGRPGMEAQLLWGGMVRFDWLAFIFKMIFLFGAAITALFAMDVENLGNRGEFYLLLLVTTMGMGLMAAAGDLILLYLAIETTSIPLYVLAGFMIKDKKSTESGFKYLFFGALTSAIMLYGFSLLYGFAGTTSIYDLAAIVKQGDVGPLPLFGVLLLVLVGFGFKISAVPFHFWAPDVYEGAPTPVTGFLSTASKAAGFAVLMRVLLVVFPESLPSWTKCSGDIIGRQYDPGEFPGPGTAEYEAPVGLFFNRSCWICPDRGGGFLPFGHGCGCILSGCLPAYQPGGLRCGGCLLEGDRLRRNC